jgi:PAS domain S-box-containing protein
MGASADSAVSSGTISDAGDPWSGLIDFTAAQLMADAAALPAVLQRITTASGAECALALAARPGLPPACAAGYPAGAAADAALYAQICSIAADGGLTEPRTLEAAVGTARRRRGVVLVTSGRPEVKASSCVLAVVGRTGGWAPEALVALRACAAIIGAALRARPEARPDQALAAALLAGSPAPVVAIDESGLVREFNHAAERLYRIQRSQALGQDAFALLVPDRLRAPFREAIAAYLSTRDTAPFGTSVRVQGIRPDGTRPMLLLTVVPVHARDGVYFGAFLDEVGSDEESGQHLTEADVRFGMLSELAPVGIVQTDVDGLCTFVNGRWCKLTGQETDAALGRPWLDSVHPRDAGTVRAKLAAALRDGRELRADFRLRSGSEDVTWVHAAIRPVRAPDGRTTGHLAAFTNVDAHKRAEAEREAGRQQLAAQNVKLRDLDLAKTRFLGTVSHELRSPLTSIVSFTELLRDDAASMPAGAADYLEIIQRNAERLLRLVGDLLYLDRLDEGGVSLDLGPVQVPQVATDAVAAGSAAAAEAGVELSLATSDGPDIEADAGRLQQILDNLISNAVKFSDRDSRVRVGADYEGGEWRLSVADQGIGIPEEDLGQLFDRFFRASNAVGSQLPGTGLGLATAKAIAELHGGSIGAESQAGEGTTFTVRLPVRR